LRFLSVEASVAKQGGAVLRLRAVFRLGAIGLLAVGPAMSTFTLTYAAVLQGQNRPPEQTGNDGARAPGVADRKFAVGYGVRLDIVRKECESRGCNCEAPNGDCTKVSKDVDYEACFKQSGEMAIVACTRTIASDHYDGSNLAALYNNRGIEYNAKGDYDDAIADYDQAIKLEPRYALAYNNRGLTYAAKSNYDRAIADYSQAILIDPLPKSGTYINVYDNRGQAYAAKGDYEHAIADYSEAIRIDPKCALAHNNRGIVYAAKGDFDRAIADYSQAIRIDAKNALLYNNRGQAYATKGDYDRAIADYGQAIRITPMPASVMHINVYDNRGLAHAARGYYDDAIADYTEAIQIDPNYPMPYKNRGDAFAAKGDYDGASADYAQAIRLDPKNAGAYFNRGLAEFYAGALPKALADLNQTSELSPKDAYAALWLDVVDKHSNLASRLAAAITQFDMTKWPAPVIRLYLGETTPEAVLAAADDPRPEMKRGQLCEANFFIGELALQQGAKDEATQLFRFAASNCPKDYVQLDAAVAELKALGAEP
jgi:tetratricopeptide (TPR) repeat protein